MCTVTHHTCVMTNSHTATHCNTLQHTATHCNTLHHTASHVYRDFSHVHHDQFTHSNTQQHTSTHCTTRQNPATPHNATQHTATHVYRDSSYVRRDQSTQRQRHPAQRNMARNAIHTLQHTATHCNTLQHTGSAIPHKKIWQKTQSGLYGARPLLGRSFFLILSLSLSLSLSFSLLSLFTLPLHQAYMERGRFCAGPSFSLFPSL